MRALIQKIKAWLADDGRQDGYDYAMATLAKNPAAGDQLLRESQDMFGENGWWPFNAGIVAALDEYHKEPR